MEAAAQTQKPEENLGFFRYAVNFTKGLIKDNKFWSRFNAIPNGVIFIAQGVGAGVFLVAGAPLIAQVAGFAGCAALCGIGLYGIGYGFPRAWQSMEGLCARTFPKFNPPKAVREPVAALANKIAQKPWAKKFLKNPVMRFWPQLKTEQQQDIFLAALTLEGASAAGVACAVAIAPHIMALPAVTIAGGFLIAGACWTIATCAFDVYSCAKTLVQAFAKHRQEKKAKKAPAPKQSAPAPQPQEPQSKPLPAPVAAAFNKKADGAEAPQPPAPPPKPAPPPAHP